MAHIRLDDNEIELNVGELWIGTDDAAGVRLTADPTQGNLAIIAVDPRGAATVRRAAPGITVQLNGVALGAEPAPLLHGDRIEVAGRQLRFSDDTTGRTMLVPAFGSAAATAKAAERGRGLVAGGRLVSLTDGREYAVPASGLRIGRDVDCDIVVAGGDVSRTHAEVTLGTGGYFVRDLSTNGVLVNGARSGDAQLLRRGDLLRIGAEEFRFYAGQSTASVPALASAPRGAHNDVVNADRAGPALSARPMPAPGRGDATRVSRGVPPVVWLAAAVLLGATVLIAIQDR